MITEGSCPAWRISNKPATRCFRNRFFHREMAGAVVSQPLFNRSVRNTFCQHQDQPGSKVIARGSVRDCIIRSNSACSSEFKATALALRGMSQLEPDTMLIVP